VKNGNLAEFSQTCERKSENQDENFLSSWKIKTTFRERERNSLSILSAQFIVKDRIAGSEV
jgi:hypothetical protein